MNRTLWKLQQIGERLWILASTIAQHAAALGRDGKGFAVVAEETRKMTETMQSLIEKAIFDDEIINKEKLAPYAKMLNLLALNTALEAFRLWEKGKQAAVCAEEIRKLAHEISVLLDDKPIDLEDKIKQIIPPYPRKPLTSVNPHCEFMLFPIAGVRFVENLSYIQEIAYGVEQNDGYIKLRGNDIPVISLCKTYNGMPDNPTYIIIDTPWAEKNSKFAIAADSVDTCECLFYSPIGTPIEPPSDFAFAKYVRECWENENGDPYYFMDWVKLAQVN